MNLLNLRIKSVTRLDISCLFFAVLCGFFFARIICAGDDKILALLGFATMVLLLYLKQFEFFILLMLIVNQDFFYLLPRGPVGDGMYQDLLFVAIPVVGAAALFKRNYQISNNFRPYVALFFVLVVIAIANSTFHGQLLGMGIKAAKGYYLFLLFFIFISRPIDTQRLAKLVVGTGVLLMLLNNIQYMIWDGFQFFQLVTKVDYDLERAGKLRFLVGEFFTIFAPIVALGEFLRTDKKAFLLAFLYMVATVIIQGQTRAVMFGFLVTTLVMFYLSQRIRIRAFAGGILLLIASAWIVPALGETFLGDIFQETTQEVTKGSGNVGVRLKGYEYYWGEISKSAFFGIGVWNDAFTAGNPEDVKHMGIHLSDVGITALVVHMGFLGLIWLLALLVKVHKACFQRIGSLRENVNLGVLGYFVFSLSTFATLNGFTNRFTIIYLALALAIVSQTDVSQERRSLV